MRPGRVPRSLIATLLALALVGPAAASATSASERFVWEAKREANIIFAVIRAKSELSALSLPPGSRRARSFPPSAAALVGPIPVEAGTATVLRYQLWVVPRDPSEVFRWIEDHDPHRFRTPGGGEFVSGFFDDEPVEVVPSRQARGGGGEGLIGSTLTVSALHLSHHRSAVRVEAAVTWVRPRPPWERVPAAAAKVLLKIEHHPDPNGPVVEDGEFAVVPPSNEGEVRSLMIGSPARVTQIIGLVDRLPIVQSGPEVIEVLSPQEEAVGEPGAPLPSTVHLLFESPSGRVLAEASQREGGGGELMRFAVGGKVMRPLENGVKVLRALIQERRRAPRTQPPDAPRQFP